MRPKPKTKILLSRPNTGFLDKLTVRGLAAQDSKTLACMCCLPPRDLSEEVVGKLRGQAVEGNIGVLRGLFGICRVRLGSAGTYMAQSRYDLQVLGPRTGIFYGPRCPGLQVPGFIEVLLPKPRIHLTSCKTPWKRLCQFCKGEYLQYELDRALNPKLSLCNCAGFPKTLNKKS